jgi:hypothetical protein
MGIWLHVFKHHSWAFGYMFLKQKQEKQNQDKTQKSETG